jgi:pimeloyl-ACP methyl ester carboxylesterase
MYEGYVTTADGVDLYFRVIGSGPRTLFMPNGLHLLEDFAHLAEGRRLVCYDVRNRGRSSEVRDASKLTGAVHRDVEDLETVRRHFDAASVDLLGHSYVGLTVVLYAVTYPQHVGRIVQMGPMAPDGRMPSPQEMAADPVVRDVFTALAALEKDRETCGPEEYCRKIWSVLGRMYVTNASDAGRINWGRCELANERNFMGYWNAHVLPSIRELVLTKETLAPVTVPVLTIHGTKDRSAPLSGSREWILRLPNARLLAVENGGHAPWIEAPDQVFGAVRTFLEGAWPKGAETLA